MPNIQIGSQHEKKGEGSGAKRRNDEEMRKVKTKLK